MEYPNFENASPTDYSPKQIKKKYPEFYDWLISNYTFADSFKEKLFCWRNNINERPVCKVCGGYVKFAGQFFGGYRKYCSTKCTWKDPETKKKTEQTCLERYGVTSTNKLPENRKKSVATFKKNYKDNPDNMEDLRNRRSKTTMDRYGVEVFFQSDKFKEEYKHTMQERYGVNNYGQTKEHKEKCEKTSLERYGAKHYMSSIAGKKRVRETFLERYGVESAVMLPSAKNANGSDSENNLAFENMLDSAGIEHTREYELIRYRYDFKVDNYLIEINPSPTHNSTWGVFNNPPKTETYHKEKSDLAEQNGLQCIHIWDWDEPEKVVNMLKPRQQIYARNCVIVEINSKEANRFLEEHHLQGGCKGQKVCLSLQKDGDILEVMTFGKPRYNKNVQCELLRLCTKTGFTVVGGSERLFKYFLENYHPESIVSYCDRSKFSGEIYTRLGFKIIKKPQPSKHWFNMKTGQHVTDNLLRQRGYDQLFKTNYGKGTDNEELMLEAGFVEIWDCGQSTYIWKC